MTAVYVFLIKLDYCKSSLPHLLHYLLVKENLVEEILDEVLRKFLVT